MRSGLPQQGKRAQGCVLPVCMSSHPSCAPLGTHLCQSCLGAAHPQIIFPFPCAFSHHQKGCELILASCPAHWDNYGFGVNITPACGQAWDLPAGFGCRTSGRSSVEKPGRVKTSLSTQAQVTVCEQRFWGGSACARCSQRNPWSLFRHKSCMWFPHGSVLNSSISCSLFKPTHSS